MMSWSSRSRSASCWPGSARYSATPPATAAPRLVLGGLEFDPASRQVLVGGQPVTLTAVELGILEILLRRSPAVVGPRLIARHVRASDAEASGSDLVDAHVAGLRAQLAGSGLQVQTVSGFGYRIIALPDARLITELNS